ncbi:MAG: hypothetical protein ACI4CT_05410 [Lachnospiraceae bacterium]
MDWMDFNNDGEVDAVEEYMGMEMLCSSREEHEALFGDPGDFDDDSSDDFDDDLDIAGLDRDELEFMDEDERREALEDAGLDPDDYDF